MRDFNHTVNVLVKAFFEETLVHANCYACAVGNIVADSIGTKVVKVRNELHDITWENREPYPALGGTFEPGWGAVFSTSDDWDDYTDKSTKVQSIDEKYLLSSPRARFHIDSTGYTWQELARIEFAFENVKGSTETKRMFKGLMKVVDVLADIHGIDLKAKEEAKLLFVKA
jgi:hypothetical protein